MNAKLWMTLVMLSGLASVFAQTCKEPNWYNATDAAGGHLLHGTASGTTQNEASEKAWSMALMQLGLSNVTELRSTLEVYKSVTNGQPANVQVNQSNVSSGETKLQAGKDLLLIRESAGIASSGGAFVGKRGRRDNYFSCTRQVTTFSQSECGAYCHHKSSEKNRSVD